MNEPISLTTDNVAKELASYAKQNAMPISKLCVDVNSIATYVKTENSDFIEIYESDFSKYTNEDSLRNNTVEFRQEYDIKIRKHPRDYPFRYMSTIIEFEENDTLAYFVIKKSSRLEYYDGLYEDFLNYIDEQRLRSNVLLDLFDADFQDSINEFVKLIKQIKTIVFKEDKKILVSKGVDRVESVSSNICMNIEERNEVGTEDDQGRVDYSDRGFLLNCTEGEQLFEFIKPQQGKYGRTCKGKILEVEIINLDAQPLFTVEDSIEVQDSFENIKYLSSKSGYLVKHGNSYEVSNSIDVDEISFNTTGTINSDLDSEISINVIKENPLEDAIEEGMRVKVQKLSIQGSVGPSTKIEARDISITGQTHQDSSIQCVNAKIGNHRGTVIGRKVEVDALEGGEIIADEVIIKNAVRGRIRAKIIKIEILGSHVTMEASEYIEIETSKGEENTIIIDPSVDSGLDNVKKDNTDYLKKLKNELNVLSKAFKELTLKVKNSLKQCEQIKNAIVKNKNEGIPIPLPLIKNFKICKVMKVRYKKLKEDVTYKKLQIEKVSKGEQHNNSSVFETSVIVNNPLRGFNHIVYKLQNPDREIRLNTDASMKKKIFRLVEDEDGALKIVNVD